MEEYFRQIEEQVALCYKVADTAKKKGYDPINAVEIPLAKNMAERVEGLISIVAPQIKDSGIAQRLAELERQFGILDWRVALMIALEVAQERFCKFKSRKEAIETGIRVGFAYITVGVVASPLEGFVELNIKKRMDGKDYFCLSYSGPVRSAGGTGGSVSVLIADYVRKNLGYHEYDPTHEEVERIVTEIEDYHERVTNLQYLPSKEEIRFLVKNLPVQIAGDASEEIEVSNYKDLERIGTSRVRNGVCLVIAECLAQKAQKVFKQINAWGMEFGMEHWLFLDRFLKIQKKAKARGASIADSKIEPDYTYIKDLVAGRPVLSHPLAKGGFRLRYGRCRNSGLSSNAIHPATMVVLDDFLAIGTQLKTERPGKGTALVVCDSIEGPIVKLNNDSVLRLETKEDAKEHFKEIAEILFLGDMLVSYGDFFNRAHKLVPCGYNEEWHAIYLKEKGVVLEIVSAKEAIEHARTLGVPLHPRFTYHWGDISREQLMTLMNWLKKAAVEDEKVIIPLYDTADDADDKAPKRILELLGVPHIVVNNEYVVIEKDDAIAFSATLNLKGNIDENLEKIGKCGNVLDIVSEISGMTIKDKSGIFIGARMGRPEKAKMRKLTGSPHVLFPVGDEGGRLRSFQSAIEKGYITADFPLYTCIKCSKDTVYPVCTCGGETKKRFYCSVCRRELFDDRCHNPLPYMRKRIDIRDYLNTALHHLGIKHYPELIKGVRGTSNKNHTMEHLAKGVLRALHKLYVNKEGTIRYDMTELALTHFRPKEIGTGIEKLRELGYDKDVYGNKLENDEQIVELKPQDVVLPLCPDSSEEGADRVMFRVANFIDELLTRFYGLSSFYNLEKESDLVGHLVVGLSPHTSAGVVARIIGFSKTSGFMAHPLYHCLLRRDADGDEAAIILLLDALINFSKNYLPAHRGAVQDAPLVLTSRIIPTEVDDMVFDMDVAFSYPLELYEAAEQYKNPWDVKVEQLKARLGTDKQYAGYGFTHDTTNINNGVRYSAYKKIPTMQEKVQRQMRLTEKIRAADENDVARLVIEKHFIKDIKGNLRKFSMQQFRCVNCNTKYRRPPLSGKCGCGGKLIFTISDGSIVKYLEPSLQLAEKYDLPFYLKQTLELTKNRIESVFGRDKERQNALSRWF